MPGTATLSSVYAAPMPIWLQRIVSAGAMSAFITALAVSACGPLGLLLMLPAILFVVPLVAGHYFGLGAIRAVAARLTPPRARLRTVAAVASRPAPQRRARQLVLAAHLAGRAPPGLSLT
jgi:hypothetical protein